MPPYVSTMFLRPESPESAAGPPRTKEPLRFTWISVSSSIQVPMHRPDHLADDVVAQLLGVDLGVVLGGDDDGLRALRHAERVLDGDLRLAVGPQVGERAVLAQAGEAQAEVVREVDGQRHQLLGLVAGEPEHDALVAGALVVAHGRVDLAATAP